MSWKARPEMEKPEEKLAEVDLLADIDQVVHSSPRLMVLTYLYVVESVDYVFLQRMTKLTWGSLATHIKKLEEAGYIEVEKGYQGKKPHTLIHMTETGRQAFKRYKDTMKQALDSLPD
jgi:DNA-binding MarR family transcriptional regulator